MNDNISLVKKNYYLKAFAWGLGLAFCLFIPFIIKDQGMFFFYGDFNVQQIPFYSLAHASVKSGDISWSQLTDLGSGFVGSYSFYLLGSPFFWLTIPFPTEAIPYLMGPLLMLKFACASLTAFIYLKRYTKNPNFALIGGILYAFSGFSIYNIFFNHFHESIIIFPLLLWALDEYLAKRRRGVVAMFICLSVLFNYYFFIGQAVFCVIYFFVRLFSNSYKISIRDFLFLTFEVIIGVAMSGFLLMPSVIMLLGNYRISNPIEGWDAVLYDNVQRYVHIIQSLFFPPDLAARPNFTPDSGSKWSSLGAWLPLFGMTGVIAWLQTRKKHWLKKLLAVLFVCAMVPALNSVFQFFNASYYARWFYMLTLMMILATVMSLESQKVDWKRAIKWNFFIVISIGLVIGLTPVIDESSESISFGLDEYPTRFWSYVAISVVCLAILIYIFRYANKDKMVKNIAVSLSIVSFLYSVYFVALGKTQSYDPADHIIPNAINDKTMNLEDLYTARSDFYESLDNSGMYWQIPTIQAFHSIVSPSIMEFYDYIGIQRDVASRPETDDYAIRGLLSVRWLFDDQDDSNYFAGENYDTPLMEGFIFYGNANGFDIWENEYYISMGFSYDSYITKSEVETLSDTNKQLIMLKTAIIEDKDEAAWAEILPKYDITTASYTQEQYLEDCEDLAKNTADQFEYTNTGFEATFSSNDKEIVFFSVPYDQGWSATVNGKSAEILQTNVGFMSVAIPAGDDVKIVFTYTTPGLSQGIVFSVVGVILLVIYLRLTKTLKVKEHKPKKHKRKLGSFREDCIKRKINFTKNTSFERGDD
ncbi:MAG: YfhO family protein [Clostridia bacterium]